MGQIQHNWEVSPRMQRLIDVKGWPTALDADSSCDIREQVFNLLIDNGIKYRVARWASIAAIGKCDSINDFIRCFKTPLDSSNRLYGCRNFGVTSYRSIREKFIEMKLIEV